MCLERPEEKFADIVIKRDGYDKKDANSYSL